MWVVRKIRPRENMDGVKYFHVRQKCLLLIQRLPTSQQLCSLHLMAPNGSYWIPSGSNLPSIREGSGRMRAVE